MLLLTFIKSREQSELNSNEAMKEEMGNIEQFKECLGRMLCYCVLLSLCSSLAG